MTPTAPLPLSCPFCGAIPTLIGTGMDWVQCRTSRCAVVGSNFRLDEWNNRSRRPADAMERAAIPEGWQLVPKEPTEEMLRYGLDAFIGAHDAQFSKNEPCGPIYKRMLFKAPQPPAGEPEQEAGACPVKGEWRVSDWSICLGTMRVARIDFDTMQDPDNPVRIELLNWMQSRLNGPSPSPPAPTQREAVAWAVTCDGKILPHRIFGTREEAEACWSKSMGNYQDHDPHVVPLCVAAPSVGEK